MYKSAEYGKLRVSVAYPDWSPEEALVLVRVQKASVMFRAGIAVQVWRSTTRQVLRAINFVRDEVREWQRECELHQLRTSTVCTGIAEVYHTRWDGESEEHVVECGEYHPRGHGKVFCSRCQRIMELEYPQGWSYYPGDVCKHGKYVGGCGVDIMCGRCEYE